MQLSANKQAVLTRLRRMSVSDDSFIVALLLLPVLQFDSAHALWHQQLAARAGVTLPALRKAVKELVMVGAIEPHRAQRNLHRDHYYKLISSCVSAGPRDARRDRDLTVKLNRSRLQWG